MVLIEQPSHLRLRRARFAAAVLDGGVL